MIDGDTGPTSGGRGSAYGYGVGRGTRVETARMQSIVTCPKLRYGPELTWSFSERLLGGGEQRTSSQCLQEAYYFALLA